MSTSKINAKTLDKLNQVEIKSGATTSIARTIYREDYGSGEAAKKARNRIRRALTTHANALVLAAKKEANHGTPESSKELAAARKAFHAWASKIYANYDEKAPAPAQIYAGNDHAKLEFYTLICELLA